MVRNEVVSAGHFWCFQCQSDFDAKTVVEGGRRVTPALLNAIRERTAHIRLHWFDGYVSEYPDPIDEETQSIALNIESGLVVLHASDGTVHRFDDTRHRDGEGFEIFREQPCEEVKRRPATLSGPGLPFEECFDYVTVVPAVVELDWRVSSREDGGPSISERRLVGNSPRLRIEPVGVLTGGGPLSPLCDLIRPTVSASRMVLTASERTDATARAISLHLDQGLVDALRTGDVINLARTPRRGLGLSVVRDHELMVALGAVSAVPVGLDLKATVRRDQLVRPIPNVGSKTRGPWLHPVHITTAGAVPRKPKGYSIHVWYGAWPPPQDADECVSIVRAGFFPEIAAFASTHLLATSDALQVQY